MKYFVAVAEHLSFTKAAKAMFTTQPTISKQIASLERELGVQLFIRSNRNVVLTPPGKLLYEEFKELLKRVDQTFNKVKSYNIKRENKLLIGLHSLMDIHRLIPNFFKSFTDEFPNIELIIKSYSFKELRENLLEGNLDLVFTYFFEQAGNDIIDRIPISRCYSRLYFSSQLPFSTKKNLSLTDFQNECFIRLDDEESPISSTYIKHLCKKFGFKPKRIILANNLENIVFYVESGLGVTVLGSSFRIKQNNKISFLEIYDDEFIVGTDALWRKDNLNPTLKVFIKRLDSYMKYLGLQCKR